MRPISARTRSPTIESTLIESSSVRAWSAVRAGVFPQWTTCLGPPDGGRRVHRHDLTRYQKIEEHPDRREMLLHGGRRARVMLDTAASSGVFVVSPIAASRILNRPDFETRPTQAKFFVLASLFNRPTGGGEMKCFN